MGRRRTATESNAEANAAGTPAPGENKAEAAFAEYKKRMEAMGAGPVPGMGMYAAQPYPPQPPPYMLPGWPIPPPGAMMPQATPWPPAMPGRGEVPAGGGRSLMQSLVHLVQLGIELANTGLAGGMQLAEGWARPGPYGWPAHGYPPPGPFPGAAYWGYGATWDCCPDPCWPHHGCNPSVRNCP